MTPLVWQIWLVNGSASICKEVLPQSKHKQSSTTIGRLCNTVSNVVWFLTFADKWLLNIKFLMRWYRKKVPAQSEWCFWSIAHSLFLSLWWWITHKLSSSTLSKNVSNQISLPQWKKRLTSMWVKFSWEFSHVAKCTRNFQSTVFFVSFRDTKYQ